MEKKNLTVNYPEKLGPILGHQRQKSREYCGLHEVVGETVGYALGSWVDVRMDEVEVEGKFEGTRVGISHPKYTLSICCKYFLALLYGHV